MSCVWGFAWRGLAHVRHPLDNLPLSRERVEPRQFFDEGAQAGSLERSVQSWTTL